MMANTLILAVGFPRGSSNIVSSLFGLMVTRCFVLSCFVLFVSFL